MSCNCKSKCCSVRIAWVFVIIGGLNWGLTGIGMLFGYNLNAVHFLMSGAPMIEAIVYALVGVASIASIMGCRCQKCRSSNTCADSCLVEEKRDESLSK